MLALIATASRGVSAFDIRPVTMVETGKMRAREHPTRTSQRAFRPTEIGKRSQIARGLHRKLSGGDKASSHTSARRTMTRNRANGCLRPQIDFAVTGLAVRRAS